MWYQKLKDEGFCDIERERNGELVLFVSQARGLQHTPSDLWDLKRRYFELMCQAVADRSTKFRSRLDKYIVKRYAEGGRTSDIVKEIAKRGTPRTRCTVRNIIRRYEIAWKIKKAR